MSEEVKNMFDTISGFYDRMNTVLSFGIHHRWRKKTVSAANLKPGYKVLDCATGTGDLAFEFSKELRKLPGNSAEVIGTDFSEKMMEYARLKNEKNGNFVKFEFADVMDLQYGTGTFDIVSIAFGIRNVDDPKRGVSELARVTRSGGKVLILEFGQPKGLFSLPYKLYSKRIMPLVGKIIAKSEFAYTYLPETASKFPADAKFLEIMDSTQMFGSLSFRKLTFGIAYLYIGTVK